MKADAYQVITDRIVGLLQQGVIPWQSGQSMPRNLISKREYRGVNVFLLHAMMYESPYWLTFNQAKELGGYIKQGEKACPVVFWKWLDVPDADKPTGKKAVPFLRYYSVFNLAQCDGVPQDKIPVLDACKREHTAIETAERIVAGMPKRPVVQNKWPRAFYSPDADFVGMPQPELFRSGEDYYSVLFHELTHATGHESRLEPQRR